MNEKFSLSFSKVHKKATLKKSALRTDDKDANATKKESLLIYDNCKSSSKIEEEDIAPIPLPKSDRKWFINKKIEEIENFEEKIILPTKKTDNEIKDVKKLTLEEKAVAAVLQDSLGKIERNKIENDIIINSIESQKNVEMPTLEDYEEVKVVDFPSAFLRGMGWNKDSGVGKVTRKAIDIIVPQYKILGLTSKKLSPQTENDDSDELELVTGCCVVVESGRRKGIYGVVEFIGEDHISIKPSRGSETSIREVEQNVRVVSKEEYKQFSRVINKEMYDQFKDSSKKDKSVSKKEKTSNDSEKSIDLKSHKSYTEDDVNKRNKEESRSERIRNDKSEERKGKYKIYDSISKREHDNYQDEIELEESSKNRSEKINDIKSEEKKGKYKNYDSSNKRKYDNYQDEIEYRSRDSKNYDSSNKKIKHDNYQNEIEYRGGDSENKEHRKRDYDRIERVYEKEKSPPQLPVIPWITENLRVRIIDKKYKKGKFYKEKVIIKSIDTVNSCCCVLPNGKVLEDVPPQNLETVIPKNEQAIVHVVNGVFKGQKGQILMLHKNEEKASVQFLNDISVIEKFSYDDICEYIVK